MCIWFPATHYCRCTILSRGESLNTFYVMSVIHCCVNDADEEAQQRDTSAGSSPALGVLLLRSFTFDWLIILQFGPKRARGRDSEIHTNIVQCTLKCVSVLMGWWRTLLLIDSFVVSSLIIYVSPQRSLLCKQSLALIYCRTERLSVCYFYSD